MIIEQLGKGVEEMAYCRKCGHPIEDGGVCCPACGTVDNGACSTKQKTSSNNTLAVVSLCCGIASVILNFFGLLGLSAIVTGIVAKKQIDEREEPGSGLATAGIVLGCLDFAVTFFSLLVFFGRGGFG